MSKRNVPLENNEIYHIFNRSIVHQSICLDKYDYSRFIESMLYYQNQSPPIKYSKLYSLISDTRKQILDSLKKENRFHVEIIAYCLMPNHFHFLLKQIRDKGVTIFLGNFINSLVRYFNIKYDRKGPLFESKFKAKRVTTDEQLLHLSRYIHLNPYSSFITKNINDLLKYKYSSLPEYLGYNNNNYCSKENILGLFKKKASYKKFIIDQADYQRELGKIKHLILE